MIIEAFMGKKSLDQIGVNKSLLFADPQEYLKNNPIKMQAKKPMLLMVLITLMLPTLTFFIGWIWGQVWIVPTIIMGAFGLAMTLFLMFMPHSEHCVIDENGIRHAWKKQEIFAPWSLFNKDGMSKLDLGIEIHVPIVLSEWAKVRHTKGDGTEVTGQHFQKTPMMRLLPGKEMAALRNMWPIGSADYAELIRRVALTLGHQHAPTPPPAPAEAGAPLQP